MKTLSTIALIFLAKLLIAQGDFSNNVSEVETYFTVATNADQINEEVLVEAHLAAKGIFTEVYFLNADRFAEVRLEYATDGVTFLPVKTVSLVDNQREDFYFNFTDKNGTRPVNYYRYRLISFSGSESYSETIEVNIEDEYCRLTN